MEKKNKVFIEKCNGYLIERVELSVDDVMQMGKAITHSKNYQITAQSGRIVEDNIPTRQMARQIAKKQPPQCQKSAPAK